MIYKVHYTQTDLDRELEGFEFPESFDLGTSTAGYQVEGGFNDPEDPKNNWYWAEWSGQKERTGPCSRFMEKYESDLGMAAGIGLNAFRMGIEWARLQPAVEPNATDPPEFSVEAARDYARIMSASYDRGMFPAVTLHHFTNPLWAGLDFWLDRSRVTEWFTAYVEFAVGEINRLLTEEFGEEPIPYYITINEPFMVPASSYLLGIFPRGEGKGWKAALTCYENLLIGHVLAYRTIHRIYRERGWKPPTVTTNTWCAAVYGMDKMVHDLMLAKQNGVERSGVRAYLEQQRMRFCSLVRKVPHLRSPDWYKHRLESLLDRGIWRRLGPDPMPALTDLIFEGDEPRLEDALGFDYYDPFVGNNVDLRLPTLLHVRIKPWEWNVNPKPLGTFLEAYSWTSGDLPIHILENGMCYRGIGKQGWPRDDLARRDEVLKATFFEMIRSMRSGARVGAYYYWSLFDNYEWGSFEPRFGLFALDYQDGARRLTRDIMGNNAAGAYSLFARAFRKRDAAALREAFDAKVYPETTP